MTQVMNHEHTDKPGENPLLLFSFVPLAFFLSFLLVTHSNSFAVSRYKEAVLDTT